MNQTRTGGFAVIQSECKTKLTYHVTVFSLGLDDMEGDLSPPPYGGDKAVIGGTDEGHILYGGDPYFK